MKIIESIMTQNPCYTAGQKITVKGLMLHSIGCPQPDAQIIIKSWNNPSYSAACVHGFIDGNTGTIYQTLLWNHRGWHCGGAANNTHIGVEMCEPSTIKYTSGANWVDNNPTATKATVQRTYNAAVELFAYLCNQYNLDPLADGVIISHNEGSKRGVASGHVDPEHIWDKFGLTMDQFRKDVKSKMSGTTTPGTGSSITLYRVQTGAFSIKENADAMIDKLKKAGIDTLLVKTGGLYKVQVGAYSRLENAENMLKQLKTAGYIAFITTSSAASASDEIKVGSTVRVKAGAKTYTGGSLASFVYERDHTVSQISGDRVVITYNNVVVAAVKKSDLILIQ